MCLHVKICRVFEHAALRHVLFVGNAHACREAFSMNTQRLQQAYRSQEICSSRNRSRCHQFANWLCHLNLFDPLQCEIRISCLWANLSLEVDFPALEFHRVWELSKMHFRDKKSQISNHTMMRISSTLLFGRVEQGWNPRNSRITKNLLRGDKPSQTLENRRIVHATREESYCGESTVDSNWRFTE